MLLGIMGNAGSGKDVFARRLVDKHSFIQIAFADPMKRFCQEMFDFYDDQIWGISEERNKPDKRYLQSKVYKPGASPFPVGNTGLLAREIIPNSDVYLTPRFALQTLGTEWGRNCYPDVWASYAIRVYDDLQKGGCDYDQKVGLYRDDKKLGGVVNVVISDVRFRNEIMAIQMTGGNVIRLKRKGITGVVGIDGHASEEEQKTVGDHEIDQVFEVPEGIEQYHQSIDEFVAKLNR